MFYYANVNNYWDIIHLFWFVWECVKRLIASSLDCCMTCAILVAVRVG